MKILTAIFGVALTAHAAPPTLKAKVEEPVVPELMGGCSLKCGFAWTVEVQAGAGKGGATTKLLNDESADTAWIAPDGTTGIGTRLRIGFPQKLRPEVEGQTPFYGLDIINGVWKSEEQWKACGRVKKVRLHYRDKPFRDVLFADSRRWQRIEFPDFMVRSGDSLTLEILEIYPGEKGRGAAISEIVLQGAH